MRAVERASHSSSGTLSRGNASPAHRQQLPRQQLVLIVMARSSRCVSRSGGIQFISKRVDADPLLAFSGAFKPDFAVDLGVESMVSSDSDIYPGSKHGTSLPNDDASRPNCLAAKQFYAKPLRLTIATVTRTARSFFMCHYPTPPPRYKPIPRSPVDRSTEIGRASCRERV